MVKKVKVTLPVTVWDEPVTVAESPTEDPLVTLPLSVAPINVVLVEVGVPTPRVVVAV